MKVRSIFPDYYYQTKNVLYRELFATAIWIEQCWKAGKKREHLLQTSRGRHGHNIRKRNLRKPFSNVYFINVSGRHLYTRGVEITATIYLHRYYAPTHFVVLRVRLNRQYRRSEEDTQHRNRKRTGPSCCSSSDCNQGGGRPRLN